MKIAVIYSEFPYPNCPHGGGQRIFEFIRFFSRRHEIFLIILNSIEEKIRDKIPLIKPYVKNVIFLSRPKLPVNINTILHYARLYVQNTPFQVLSAISSDIEFQITQYIKKNQIDLVLLDNFRSSAVLPTLRKLFPALKIVFIDDEIPFIFKHRDFLYNLKEGIKTITRGPNRVEAFFVLLMNTQLRKITNFEKKLWSISDIIYTLTKFEVHKIQQKDPNVNVKWTTHGISREVYLESNNYHKIYKEIPDLIFMGSKHWPNLDAVKYFVNEILPIIKIKHPDIKLKVIGNLSDHLKYEISDQNVIFLGFVEDLREIFVQDCIFVLPVRLGGGIRSKIVEAMIYSIPVVSTVVGAEGFGGILSNGADIFVAINSIQFADYVCNMIADKLLRERIGNNGRLKIGKYYIWDEIYKNMENDFMKLISQ